MNIVFSYGSNSSAQLRARVENSELEAEPARAKEWQRIFCVRTVTWGGAAASMIPNKDSVTYGAVVTLSNEELARLDRFEGGYHKEELQVEIYRNDTWVSAHAIVYLANTVHWTDPPSEAYLCAIHVNLREQFEDIMPDVANNIEIYGVFSAAGNTAANHTQTTISFDDVCTGSVGSDAVVSVHDMDMTAVRLELISQWTYPRAWALSLPALCVEVNAEREVKWVMPRAVRGVVEELHRFGILSVAHLAAKLARGWNVRGCSNPQSLEYTPMEFLDQEALDLFAQLLMLNRL